MLSTSYYGNLPKSILFAKTEEEKEKYYEQILHTSDGKYTNAMFTMLRTLLGIYKKVKPEYVAFVFDKTRDTFRRTELGADFYKANRKETAKPLKEQFIQMEEFLQEIGCPQYRVTENLDVRVCALVGKRYAEQVFSPEEFSPASLRRWYKEKAKEFEEEEKEQERQKVKRAKSLKSFGNLLASDIYDLVCLNDYITESAIVKNLRGMKQTFQATVKGVENSGKYGLLTNEEVERVYSQMKREKLISEKGIDGTYGEFYIVKPQPEGKLISEIHIEEKKEYAKFLDTDWVSYVKIPHTQGYVACNTHRR